MRKFILLTAGILLTGFLSASTVEEYIGQFVKEVSSKMDWEGAGIEESLSYFLPDGKSIIYCYSVVKNGEEAGYIMVKPDKQPIMLEFSSSKFPHNRTDIEKVLKSVDEGYTPDKPKRYFYLTPGSYFVEYKDIRIDLRSQSKLANLPKYSSPKITLSEERYNGFRYVDKMPVYEYFKNTHVTSVASLIDYWGMKNKQEPENVFSASLVTYMEKCLCDLPDKPIIWRVKEGIENFSTSHNKKLTVDEKFGYADNKKVKMDFKEYKKAIDKKQPAIITFLHEPDYEKNLILAIQRRTGTSVAGAGYLCNEFGNFIIANDGLFAGEKPQSKKYSKPWQRQGVTFYNWNGLYSNMIISFVSKNK